jgi:hypothetical protein
MGIEDEFRAGVEAYRREAEQQAMQREREQRERADRERLAREEASARVALVVDLRPLIRRFLTAATAHGCKPERSPRGGPPQVEGWFLDVREPDKRYDWAIGQSLSLHDWLNVLLEAGDHHPGPAVWFQNLNRSSNQWKADPDWTRWEVGGENEHVRNGSYRYWLCKAEKRMPFAVGMRAAELGLTL